MPVTRLPRAKPRRNTLPANRTPNRRGVMPRTATTRPVTRMPKPGLPRTRKAPKQAFLGAKNSPTPRRIPSGITASSGCGPCQKAARRRAELARKRKAAANG